MKKSQKPIDLVPTGGARYQDCKEAAQEIINDANRPVNLWFNVRKGESPERIDPSK